MLSKNAMDFVQAIRETGIIPEGVSILERIYWTDGTYSYRGNGVGACILKRLQDQHHLWDGKLTDDLLKPIGNIEDIKEYSRGFMDAQDRRKMSCNDEVYTLGYETWGLLYGVYNQ